MENLTSRGSALLPARRIGLQLRITLAVLAAMLATGGIIIGTVFWVAEDVTVDNAHRHFAILAENKAVRTREHLNRGLLLTRAVTSYAAAGPEHGFPDPQAAHRRNKDYLYHLLKENPGFTAAWFSYHPGLLDGAYDDDLGSGPYDSGGYYMPCYLRRATGEIAYEPPPPEDPVAHDNDWYSIPAARGRETLTEPIHYAYDGKPENKTWVFAANAPIYARLDGPNAPPSLIGVGGMDWGMEEIQTFFNEETSAYPGMAILLFSNNGKLVARSKGSMAEKTAVAFTRPGTEADFPDEEFDEPGDIPEVPADSLPDWLRNKIMAPELPLSAGENLLLAAVAGDDNNSDRRAVSQLEGPDGLLIDYVAYQLVVGRSGQPWTFVMAAPSAEIRSQLADLRLYTAIAGTAALFFAILLAPAIARIAARAVIQRDRLYEAILDLLPVPLSLRGTDYRWTVINQAAERLLGVPRSALLGREQPPENVSTPMLHAISRSPDDLSREHHSHQEVTFGEHHYEVDTCILETGNDERHGYLSVVRDVTDRAHLATALREVTDIASGIADEAVMIAGAGQNLAEQAREQASAIDEARQSLGVIGEHAHANSGAAAAGRNLALQVRDAAREGTTEAGNTAAAISGVTEASLRVAHMAKLVDDIAFQTNLLALNASIEAARAGRHGKGFAVVADEVRSLSARSARAAHDASELITEMTGKIGQSSDIVTRLENALRQIVGASDLQDGNSEQMADATGRQSASVTSVLQHLERIAELARRSGGDARDFAQAAVRLEERAANLRTLMAALVLGDSVSQTHIAPRDSCSSKRYRTLLL